MAVCAPLGIVFGIVAKQQIRRTGQQGNGLATAGIVISALWVGLIIVLFLVGIATNTGSSTGTTY